MTENYDNYPQLVYKTKEGHIMFGPIKDDIVEILKSLQGATIINVCDNINDAAILGWSEHNYQLHKQGKPSAVVDQEDTLALAGTDGVIYSIEDEEYQQIVDCLAQYSIDGIKQIVEEDGNIGPGTTTPDRR